MVAYAALVAPPLAGVVAWLWLMGYAALYNPPRTLLEGAGMLPKLVGWALLVGFIPGAIVGMLIVAVRLAVGPLRWWGVPLVAYVATALSITAFMWLIGPSPYWGPQESALLALVALPIGLGFALLDRRLGIRALAEPFPTQ